MDSSKVDLMKGQNTVVVTRMVESERWRKVDQWVLGYSYMGARSSNVVEYGDLYL